MHLCLKILGQRIFKRNTYPSFVMYNVFSSPDNEQFDAASGTLILPANLPVLLNTQMPPGPDAKRFQALSTFIPSGNPFKFLSEPAVV